MGGHKNTNREVPGVATLGHRPGGLPRTPQDFFLSVSVATHCLHPFTFKLGGCHEASRVLGLNNTPRGGGTELPKTGTWREDSLRRTIPLIFPFCGDILLFTGLSWSTKAT
jgi:hypothetical protein